MVLSKNRYQFSPAPAPSWFRRSPLASHSEHQFTSIFLFLDSMFIPYSKPQFLTVI